MNRTRIKQTFAEYTSKYNASDPKIKLKIDHTYRVAALAERIAKTVTDVSIDTDLAWAMGMLHDIGRFEQVKRYGTFVDSESVDHAALGISILFDEGLLDSFGGFSEKERKLIRISIANHNKFRIPEGMDDLTTACCNILRDADKIDLFRVYARYLDHPEQVWQVSLEDLGSQAISPKVLEEALAGKLVHTEYKKTALDFFTGCLCQLFDVTYGPSREIICRQGYFAKLLGFQPGNPKSARQLEQVKVKLRHWLVSGPPTLVR